MKYPWIDEYLLSKKGVTRDLQESWNWIRYHVGGKMFAAICLNEENKPYYINLKLEPLEGDYFRSQYEDVIPGYYSNKVHWNSINPDGSLPDELLKNMSLRRQRHYEVQRSDSPGAVPEHTARGVGSSHRSQVGNLLRHSGTVPKIWLYRPGLQPATARIERLLELHV